MEKAYSYYQIWLINNQIVSVLTLEELINEWKNFCYNENVSELKYFRELTFEVYKRTSISKVKTRRQANHKKALKFKMNKYIKEGE